MYLCYIKVILTHFKYSKNWSNKHRIL